MTEPQTEGDRRKLEMLQCYRRGWKHGASSNPQDKRFLEHERAEIMNAYQRGYQEGMAASLLAACRECERLQFDPLLSVLRKPAPGEPPP